MCVIDSSASLGFGHSLSQLTSGLCGCLELEVHPNPRDVYILANVLVSGLILIQNAIIIF